MVDLRHAVPRYPFSPPHPTDIDVEIVGLDALGARGVDLSRAHRIDFHQVMYVADGHVDVEVDFVRDRVRPGQIAWVRPGQIQRTVVGPTGYRATMVLFTDQVVGGLPGVAPALGRLAAATVFDDDSGVADVIDRLGREIDHSAGGIEVARYLLAVLVLSLDRARAALTATLPPLALAFLSAVETHFASPRTLTTYTRELGCSPRNLARTTRSALDLSPKEVIDRRRTLEAKRLLIHTDLPVATIGRRFGVPDPSTFGKLFRRYERRSPGSIRVVQHS